MGKTQLYNSKEAPKNIQQPYSFTEQMLSFNFSIYELRIIFRILEQIKMFQKRNKNVQIDIDNNVELLFPVSAFMLPNNKNNNDIKQAMIGLREKTITHQSYMEVEIDGVLEKLPADQFLGMIESPKWAHNNSFVSFKLNETWFRYLNDLSRGYTQYLSSVGFNCSSPEIVKMYSFINHWFKFEGKILKWTNFKKEFNIALSYNTHKIIHRFLIPAKKELDSIADRSFNYTIYYQDGSIYDVKKPVKGKRVDKISFAFYNNNKNKKFYELSDFEHIEAEKWIKKITYRHKLTETNVKILYSLIQRYSLPYFVATEVEHRKTLKQLKEDAFINAIAAIIRAKDK